MAGGVAGREDEFEGAGGGFDGFIAGEDTVGNQFLEITADSVERGFDALDEFGRDSGFVEDGVEPEWLFGAAGDAGELIEFGGVHVERCAGFFEQAFGLADVIGMGMGEEDLTNCRKRNADVVELRGEFGVRLFGAETAIHQHVAIAERQQVDVDVIEFEGQRQRDLPHAIEHGERCVQHETGVAVADSCE